MTRLSALLLVSALASAGCADPTHHADWMSEIAARYARELAPLGAFDLPVEREGCESAWHLYPLRLKAERWTISRDRFIEALRERNIGTSVHFIAVHTFTYYREKYGYAAEDYPVAFGESERIVTIPLHPGLSDGDVQDVIDAVQDITRHHA